MEAIDPAKVLADALAALDASPVGNDDYARKKTELSVIARHHLPAILSELRQLRELAADVDALGVDIPSRVAVIAARNGGGK